MAKKIPEHVDAGALLSIMRPDREQSPIPDPPEVTHTLPQESEHTGVQQEGKPRDEGKKRKHETEDEYVKLFIRSSSVSARTGKSVYVRKEFHDRIQRIIQVIGKNDLTLFAYVDHVLAHHFDMYEEEIRKLYKKNYEDIY